MAVATIPKSEIRTDENITIGYATVPATITENGELAWGLPGGVVTTSKHFAEAFCAKLDIEIRRGMKNPSELLTART